MKKNLFICILSITSLGCIAQSKMGQIDYNFHYNLQNYVEGYIYKSKLYFNNSKSLFIYNSKELEKKNGFRKSVKYRSGSINGAMYSRTFDDIGNLTYIDFSSNEMVSRELLNGKYPVAVTEKIPSLEWNITKDSKKIGDFTCYKAESINFRGRSYIAWFTYELPVSTGPWKFQGLPGIILEVYDDASQIHIKAESVKYPLENEVKMEKPTESETMNIDDFLEEKFKLYNSYVNNQKALFATGRLLKKITPLPYRSIEYNVIQQKQLNELKAIVLPD